LGRRRSSSFEGDRNIVTGFHLPKFGDRAQTENKVGIGFDFGTSNSAVAVFDGQRVTVVSLEDSGLVMPSATYIDRRFRAEVGQRAILEYIERNRGRRVEFRAEVLGEARVSTGQYDERSGLPTTADTFTLYGQDVDDFGLPGRLFYGIKRLLADEGTERIAVFGKPMRLVALMTPILEKMRRRLKATLRSETLSLEDIDRACLGHPVQFEGGGSRKDALALSRVSEAYRHAGIVRQSFCPEPIAAAIGYLNEIGADRPRRILTVDFGGGTLDLCIVRCDEAYAEVESVHGLGLGGNLIDQVVVRELILPLLGKGERWRRRVDGREVDTAFPFMKYEQLLLNWQVTYLLNQNEYTTPIIERKNMGDEGARKLERLYQLITQNLSFELFQAVKKAKERLSVDPIVRIDIPEIDIDVRLERAEFEAMIRGPLETFDQAVQKVLDDAGLGPSDVDVVLRTGGSALIPAFTELLERRFPAKVVQYDPFTGVASGLAVADYYGIGNQR
jgi:hypothetical chaperone protein